MKRNPEAVFVQWLVINSQRGDQRAFNLLVKRWNPKLIHQAYRLTHNAEAAHDIAQESWQGIVKGLNKLKDPAVFPAWSLRIVTRRAADWIRKIKKDRKINTPDVTEANETSDALDREHQLTVLQKALKELPGDQRIILQLYYLEEQSVKSMAEILGLPAGTVKSRLFYAREHLKKIFKQIDR